MSKFFAFLETVVILGAFILFSNTKFKYSKNLLLIIEKKNKTKTKMRPLNSSKLINTRKTLTH